MHTYSTDNELRPRVYWALSLVSYFAAGAVGSIVAFISGNLPFALSLSVGAGVVFKGFLVVYNKWIWNSALAKNLGITKVPDLNGDWNGWLKTSWEGNIDDEALHAEDDSSDESDWRTLTASLQIEQTWREINVHLETESSYSDSNGATILTDDGRWPSINYQYRNGGSGNSKDALNTHDGTADLTFKEGEEGRDVLEGIYYTGPGRGNHGKMRFVRGE